jgi:MYXO-CTERM domain-containing protein
VGYTGEQWRYGGIATDPEQIDVSYSLNVDPNAAISPMNDTAATYTQIPALTFASKVTSGTAGSLDGTAAANQTIFAPVTISGLSWLPGTDLWIRFDDQQANGNDDGLAIDNVSFSAISTGSSPEPAALGLLALVIPAIIRRRR